MQGCSLARQSVMMFYLLACLAYGPRCQWLYVTVTVTWLTIADESR